MKNALLGRILADYRHRSGLSQLQAAKLVGNRNPQFISNIERGLCPVPLLMLKALISTYGISEIEKSRIVRLMLAGYKQKIESVL